MRWTQRGPSSAFSKALAAVRGLDAPTEPEPLTAPPIAVFEADVPVELARVLPFRLDVGEQVLALADASCDRWNVLLRDAGWIAVTDRRLLVTKQESLRRVGAIDIDMSVEDIRYVRRPDRGDKAPIVDVITKDADLTVQFPSWTKTGDARGDADRFAELVASFMNLPASEVPESHVREQVAVKPLVEIE